MRGDDIIFVNTKPSELGTAIVEGKLDAISIWNPHHSVAAKNLGEKAVVFDGRGIYYPYFVLTATKEFVTENKESVIKLVRALVEASRFLEQK